MESKSEAAVALARNLVDDVELSRLAPEAVLFKAFRLARLLDDESAVVWLRFELDGYTNTPEAKFWMARFGRFTNAQANQGYWISLSGVVSHLGRLEAELSGMNNDGTNYLQNLRKGQILVELPQLSSIRSKVLALVHEFALTHYHALAFGNIAASIFEAHRTAIDEVLARLAPDVLEKLDAISERLASDEPEAISQAMNSVRRMIKSLADHLYPPAPESVVVEGKSYEVGTDKVLNRLELYLQANCASETRRKRLNRSIRDIHERSSAGAHTDITRGEARSLLLASYLTLGEIAECGRENVP